ncbi:MAG TPA: glycosyltransferase family 4 protein [Allosphingosinicella sp.]|nr:glycosyltransferase family 4 protein [Allosphingosinicella sp.]
MIHIVHLFTCLGRGGAERALADIVAAMDRTRFRHTICYLTPPHDLKSDFSLAGCETVFLDVRKTRNWGEAAGKLVAQLERLKPDLVQSATSDANITARLAARRAGLPQLTWLVSMEFEPAAIRAAGWPPIRMEVRRYVERWTARRAETRWVACSGAVARSARSRLGARPERTELIYNAVGLSSIQAAPGESDAVRAQLGLPPGAFTYLMVGRMDSAKAHGIALEAFASVADEQPDAHFILIGRGTLRGSLIERAAAAGLAERTHFIESVEKIAPYLTAADAFLFPSLLEGLPVAVLEAMSAGLPVIVSDLEPHVEVVEDGRTGLIVPRGDSTSMAAKMRLLHADADLRYSIGTAARDEAVARFSTTAIVPRWERLYERLAGENR